MEGGGGIVRPQAERVRGGISRSQVIIKWGSCSYYKHYFSNRQFLRKQYCYEWRSAFTQSPHSRLQCPASVVQAGCTAEYINMQWMFMYSVTVRSILFCYPVQLGIHGGTHTALALIVAAAISQSPHSRVRLDCLAASILRYWTNWRKEINATKRFAHSEKQAAVSHLILTQEQRLSKYNRDTIPPPPLIQTRSWSTSHTKILAIRWRRRSSTNKREWCIKSNYKSLLSCKPIIWNISTLRKDCKIIVNRIYGVGPTP